MEGSGEREGRACLRGTRHDVLRDGCVRIASREGRWRQAIWKWEWLGVQDGTSAFRRSMAVLGAAGLVLAVFAAAVGRGATAAAVPVSAVLVGLVLWVAARR